MGLGGRGDLKRMEKTIGNTKQLPTHVVDAGLSNREKVLMNANIAGGRPNLAGGGKVKDQQINYREGLGSGKLGINPDSRLGNVVSRTINLHKKALHSITGNKKAASSINMKGQCRDNTCVTFVGDMHAKSGLDFPKKVDNNRELQHSFKNKKGLGKDYKQVRRPSKVRKGDIVTFHEDKVKDGKKHKMYGYHTGIVNKVPKNKSELKSGKNFTYIGSGGTEERTPTRKIYKSNTLKTPNTKSKTKGIRYYTRKDS